MSLLDSFDRNKTKCKNCKKYFDKTVFTDEGWTYTLSHDWCFECRKLDWRRNVEPKKEKIQKTNDSIVYRTVGDIIEINEQKSN